MKRTLACILLGLCLAGCAPMPGTVESNPSSRPMESSQPSQSEPVPEASSQPVQSEPVNEGSSQSVQSEPINEASSQPVPSEPVGGSSSRPASSPASSPMDEQAARKIALEHAGLSEEQVHVTECKLEWDDGRQVYDVEFYHTGSRTEYDYTIDAQTGEIRKYSAETTAAASAASGQPLTAEEAGALALARVPGAARTDLVELETDYDDGRLEYEGEIRYGGKEYEFEIDGASGQFLKWEEDDLH